MVALLSDGRAELDSRSEAWLVPWSIAGAEAVCADGGIFRTGFLKNVAGNFALTCGDVNADPRSSYTQEYRQMRPTRAEIRTLEVDRAMGDVSAAPRLPCENRGRPGCMEGVR